MAGHGHEGVDPSMRAISSAASTARLVDLDVRDDEVVGVEPLRLRVGLRVLQQAQQELAALLRPAPDWRGHVLALRMPLDAQLETHEGDDLLLLDDVVQVLLRAGQLHVLDRSSRLPRVLETHAQIAAASLHGCVSRSRNEKNPTNCQTKSNR